MPCSSERKAPGIFAVIAWGKPMPARDSSADSITWTAAGMREGGIGA